MPLYMSLLFIFTLQYTSSQIIQCDLLFLRTFAEINLIQSFYQLKYVF